jgi:hypothetical protein
VSTRILPLSTTVHDQEYCNVDLEDTARFNFARGITDSVVSSVPCFLLFCVEVLVQNDRRISTLCHTSKNKRNCCASPHHLSMSLKSTLGKDKGSLDTLSLPRITLLQLRWDGYCHHQPCQCHDAGCHRASPLA